MSSKADKEEAAKHKVSLAFINRPKGKAKRIAEGEG